MASNVDDITDELRESSMSDSKGKFSVNYFPLKMNRDRKTEMYVKFAKVMVIAQGSYTDERESEFKTVEKVFKYASCVVSDEKFRRRHYDLTPEETETFYAYCKETAKEALEEGHNLLVIDSTMSNIHQNRYYVALAYKMQYVILVIPPIVVKTSNHKWPKGSLAYSFRTELSTIIQPVNMYQHLFCAWYLHDRDSNQLRDLATLYMKDCIEGIPEFNNIISRNCPKQGPNGEELSPLDGARHYFGLIEKRQDLAFCPVKVFGDLIRSMNEYFKKEAVVNGYGKMSKLLIAGFVISKNMIAARVKLSHQQKDFWEMDEELDEDVTKRHNIIPCPSQLLEESKKNLPDIKVQLISSKCNETLVNAGQTLHAPLESIPPYAKGRACHIVLGKKKDAPFYNVDYDVQFALKREKNAMKAKADMEPYDLENCLVKKIGGYWFIYMKEMYRIDAIFASCVKPYPFDDPIKC